MSEGQLRLFVAIQLSEEWLKALGSAQESLRRDLQGGPRLRYVRPEGIHLTLKFLGATDASKLASIESALASATGEFLNLQLKLGRPSHFADRRGTRVVLITIEGETDGLRRLAERIDTWLGAAGLPREKRGFTAHLTLARVPETATREDRATIAEAIMKLAAPSAPPMVVASVSLMRSHLGPGGARYERLARFPA